MPPPGSGAPLVAATTEAGVGRRRAASMVIAVKIAV
jgi:hypothetical protein